MSVVVHDPNIADRLIAERRASGADRYDEVWEGVYMMAPMPDMEHQEFVGALTGELGTVVMEPGLGVVLPGANVSPLEAGWNSADRVPDILVCVGRRATKRKTYWSGPIDLPVEVVSPEDPTREKLSFYGRLGVRELLVIDREPWGLSLYRGSSGKMRKARESQRITSAALGLSFRLVEGSPRPRIEATHDASQRTRLV